MTDVGANSSGYAGQKSLSDAASDFNVKMFLIKQALGLVNVATPVLVKGVTNDGSVSPVGFVDVLPLVNLLDGLGQASPHGTVFRLPYIRVQGGANAVILDPQVGDVGLAVFCDRDIASVKNQRGGPANPGSYRRFSMADGVYLGGILNGAPTCYVQFVDGGLNMTPDAGATQISMTPGKITIVADVVETIARTKNTWGARGGPGFVYQEAQIDRYENGVTSNAHFPPVPE